MTAWYCKIHLNSQMSILDYHYPPPLFVPLRRSNWPRCISTFISGPRADFPILSQYCYNTTKKFHYKQLNAKGLKKQVILSLSYDKHVSVWFQYQAASTATPGRHGGTQEVLPWRVSSTWPAALLASTLCVHLHRQEPGAARLVLTKAQTSQVRCYF